VTDGEGTAPPSATPPTWPVPGPGSAAPPTWGAGQGWVPPPPPRRRKLTWLWIVIGVLVVVAVVVVSLVWIFFRRIGPPIDATNVVLREVRRANYVAAYDRSCSRNRDDYTLEEFKAAFEAAQRDLGRIKSYDVDYGSVHGSRATTKYEIRFAHGESKRYAADVFKEQGKWKACLLKAK